MTRFTLLLILIGLYSCGHKVLTPDNKIQRFDNEWTKGAKIRNDFDSTMQEFLKSIKDSAIREAWKTDINDYTYQSTVLFEHLSDIGTILKVQADTVSWHTADETDNTTALLSHGLNTVIHEHLTWFDGVFGDSLYFYNTKKQIPLQHNNKLLEYWIEERSNIKTPIDFEVFQLNIRQKSFIVLDSMLMSCKRTYNNDQSKQTK
jgi:hypothetical protein